MYNFKNNARKKIVTADLNSPHWELSNGGVKSVVALLVRWWINFLSARIGRPIQLYHSEKEGHTCPFIQKREKMKSLDVIDHRSVKIIYFLLFLASGIHWSICHLFVSVMPIDQAIHPHLTKIANYFLRSCSLEVQ